MESCEAILLFRKSSMSSMLGNSFFEQTVCKENDGSYSVSVKLGNGPDVLDSHTYRAEEALVGKVFEYIREKDFFKYEGHMEAGMMGGIVAVSFLNDDRTVTITGNNVPADETQILYKVSDLITECCKEEIL